MAKTKDPRSIYFLLLSKKPSPARLETLCKWANENHMADVLPLGLNLLAQDARRLLDDIADKREQGDLSKSEVDTWIRVAKANRRPRRKTYELLSAALGDYRFRQVPYVDVVKREFTTRTEYLGDASPEQLCAFHLLMTTRTGEWQQFRRCPYEECAKFFYDHMKRGRRPQLFCCTNHGTYHRNR